MIALILCLALSEAPNAVEGLALQDGVNEVKVQLAIQKGIEYLRTAGSPDFQGAYGSSDELLLLTFLHAGVPLDDPKVREFFKGMAGAPMKRTYKVALQAMCLEKIDAAKYQDRIAACAQFLVDNQCANGQWTYGTPTTYPDAVPVPRGEVPTGTVRKAPTSSRGARNFSEPEPAGRVKPKVVQHLAVKKNRDGPAAGDNSNSQYAALGIRACHDAGIVFPREVIEKARKHWVDTQEKGAADGGVSTGVGAGVPRGWGYKGDDAKPWGSMTAGAIGAVCIYDYILGTEFRKDKSVQDGIAWLAKNFLVTDNPGKPKYFHLYYLYALERVGMLADTTRIGTHDWYLEGANHLLDNQREDGSWGSDDRLDKPAWSTCFAVLFLKQATRRLDVASTDGRK
jgi:hypothetical protein